MKSRRVRQTEHEKINIRLCLYAAELHQTHYRKSYPNWIDRIKQGRSTFSEHGPDETLSGAARGPE